MLHVYYYLTQCFTSLIKSFAVRRIIKTQYYNNNNGGISMNTADLFIFRYYLLQVICHSI